jgi:hypothetical protein
MYILLQWSNFILHRTYSTYSTHIYFVHVIIYCKTLGTTRDHPSTPFTMNTICFTLSSRCWWSFAVRGFWALRDSIINMFTALHFLHIPDGKFPSNSSNNNNMQSPACKYLTIFSYNEGGCTFQTMSKKFLSHTYSSLHRCKFVYALCFKRDATHRRKDSCCFSP